MAYFSTTPWHPVGCRCGECGEGGLVGTPHQHEDDFDADTCEICFPAMDTASLSGRADR